MIIFKKNELIRVFNNPNETPFMFNETKNDPNWQEITKEEYDALCPKEEPIQNVTINEDKTVEEEINSNG